VKLLLDTCTLLWLVAEPERISKRVAGLVDAPATELFVSDVSVWEVAMKWHAAKLVLPAPPRAFFASQLDVWNWTSVSLTQNHIFRASELPAVHRDPFDRLLVAQAIDEGLTLASPDAWVAKYPVATVW
jgi:PIN domain nuclease of toxin-antitoxin system